ncbi:NAD-dependent epimerase/dehydratase family protein [Lentisphaera profundi]|uniref:NAD-dependent epimerase/dehydratase family protein n=1 Tax=Lentisphaera profundi TaxID=1658616 RepID=A0ABY7VRG8_9BACT|nr:NAD-dependent epimerase/dehydratase family protein [Lentisphaera profundi]WDE96786.1 NAD-dependent epimerase/dehydratase family protein [Lentisphaera profundi]
MKILIAGSSGFIGGALMKKLRKNKHDVFSLVRRKPQGTSEIEWAPDKGLLNHQSIENFDAIIHLGGAPVADKIWTKAYKKPY